MKSEINLFVIIAIFFAVVGVAYGVVTGWSEPVGAVALLLSSALGAMISFYLWKTARSLPERPDDDPNGEIAQIEGAYGTFSPYSWWPLWLGLAGALVFLGIAVQMWIAVAGGVMGVWAVCGWTFEYFTGEHAH